ncbi:MAG: methylenetetrahydrofolate reductase [NAD(P)H] [Lachnospiraceae bacterium]
MIGDLLRKKSSISFEVFPPKKDGELEAAFETLDKLGAIKPDFISVTYGAGGSRSKKTVELASYIQNTLQIDALAHMTCVGSKKEDLMEVCKDLEQNNIKHVLALRGDRPKDMSDELYNAREFSHASDMITFLRENTDFEIAAACYPEKHFESFSMETDLNYLRQKQENGANFLITQLFFDNDLFYHFCEKAQNKGIIIPICAGIMPITSKQQITTTISLSGSSVPKALADLIAKYGDDKEEMRKAGIDYAIRQIQDLQLNGFNHIHIYTMNKPKMAAEIMDAVR